MDILDEKFKKLRKEIDSDGEIFKLICDFLGVSEDEVNALTRTGYFIVIQSDTEFDVVTKLMEKDIPIKQKLFLAFKMGRYLESMHFLSMMDKDED